MIKFVVCVWNAENYIQNCIRTLLNQKDTNFEVYIIDDVSTDKTVETTKNLIKDDQRFHLIVNQEKKSWHGFEEERQQEQLNQNSE